MASQDASGNLPKYQAFWSFAKKVEHDSPFLSVLAATKI